MSTSIRRATTSIERMASRTIGTSSSDPSARSTSSTSHDGSALMRRTNPTDTEPSTTSPPARADAQYSPASSETSVRGTSSSAPRSASASSREADPSRRRMGLSGVPARRTTSRTAPSTRYSSRASSGSAPTTWKDPSSPCGRPTRPASTNSLDDVDEDAPVVLDRGGLDDRPEGLRGASPASDDLAVVVIRDRQLEHERAVVLLELLDLDLVGRIHQLLREIDEQLAHELRDALSLQELLDRVGRLGAAIQPVPDPLLVEHDRRGVGLRVVATERLDEATVARRARVGDDDAPHRVLLPAHAGESHSDHFGAAE